jgi:membrane associated rhomboid family serine protease
MANSIVDEIKFNFNKGDQVLRLIIINVGLFVIIGLLGLIDSLFKLDGILSFKHYFSLPSSPGWFLRKPWTIVTYMFIHHDFFHLAGNMLMLYFGGRIFADFLGHRRVLPLYLAGGIIGALLYMLLFNTIPLFADAGFNAQLMGSSAAVLAIFFAAATYLPDYEVGLILIGSVRLKYIALVIFLIDLLSIDQSNPGGHMAHIGGALLGIAFAKGLRKGYDFTHSFNKFISKIEALLSRNKTSANRVVYRQNPRATSQSKPKSAGKQEIIDAILDKISKSGYDSLTKEEKETIFKLSKDED